MCVCVHVEEGFLVFIWEYYMGWQPRHKQTSTNMANKNGDKVYWFLYVVCRERGRALLYMLWSIHYWDILFLCSLSLSRKPSLSNVFSFPISMYYLVDK